MTQLSKVYCLNFEMLTVLWRYPGVNLMPSAKNIRGQDSRNDITVITEKRFMSSITSCIRLETLDCYYYSSSTDCSITRMKEAKIFHLVTGKKFLAEDVPRLVGEIGRHGAPKPSPDSQTKLQGQRPRFLQSFESQQQKGQESLGATVRSKDSPIVGNR